MRPEREKEKRVSKAYVSKQIDYPLKQSREVTNLNRIKLRFTINRQAENHIIKCSGLVSAQTLIRFYVLLYLLQRDMIPAGDLYEIRVSKFVCLDF